MSTPAAHEVRIPKLGLTMEDATVVEWRYEDGAKVEPGQVLLTIETDKIMFDVEAEAAGYLRRAADVGAKLNVGDLAGVLHTDSAAAATAGGAGSNAAPDAAAASPHPNPPPEGEGTKRKHPATLRNGERLMISPVARQLAHDKGLAPRSLRGTGPGGVILKRDVEQALKAPGQNTPPSPPPAGERPGGGLPPPAERAPARRPLTPMRQAISRRMMASLQQTAQMTGFGKIDMAQAVQAREALAGMEGELGVRIGYSDLVLKACAIALVRMPLLNSYIDGDSVVTWNAVDIGLAVAVDGGLLVPVIRDVDRLALPEIARARIAAIDKARSGKLAREDVEGGSFTLSNFGSYGGDFETPILNAPQSALLGIGQISDEPVVRDKQIVIRPMMSISLTFDHRLIDGADAGRFRALVRELLEQPARMLAHLR